MINGKKLVVKSDIRIPHQGVRLDRFMMLPDLFSIPRGTKGEVKEVTGNDIKIHFTFTQRGMNFNYDVTQLSIWVQKDWFTRLFDYSF
jgi:hypothetical protein